MFSSLLQKASRSQTTEFFVSFFNSSRLFATLKMFLTLILKTHVENAILTLLGYEMTVYLLKQVPIWYL